MFPFMPLFKFKLKNTSPSILVLRLLAVVVVVEMGCGRLKLSESVKPSFWNITLFQTLN